MNRRGWGNQKPPVGAILNWSHPIADGLVSCYVANEGAGIIRDLATPAPKVSTVPSWVYTSSGLGIQNAILTNASTLNVRKSGKLTGAFSVLARGTWNQKPTTFQGGELISNEFYNGNFDSGFGLIREYSPDGILFEVWNTSSQNRVRSSFTPTNNKFYDIACRYLYDTNSSDMWINGKLDASSSTTWQGFKDTPSDLIIAGSSNSSQATVIFVYVWNRVLQPSEIRHLYVNPYCFLGSPKRRHVFTSGGSNFQPAWARGSNSIHGGLVAV